MRRIIFTGGGSAGHVSPNLALIPRMLGAGWEVHYIGTHRGIERDLIGPLKSVVYHPIASGKLRRYFDVKNFTDPFRVVKGTVQSLDLMRRIRPHVVFSKGGFVSVPVSYAAALCGVPLVLHESDYEPGLANRLIAPMAKAVCTSFPETAPMISKGRGIATGTPLRPELFAGDAAEGRRRFGLASDKPVLLVTGGSQGARAINAAVRSAYPQLSRGYQILHLCGKGNLDPGMEDQPGYRQIEYLGEGLNDALAAAEIVVSRAGSNTLMELLALRKPALLIPYPTSASRGEQINNARSMEKRGFACVLMQQDLGVPSLVNAIDALWQRRSAMAGVMARVPRDEGLERVLEVILRYAKGEAESSARAMP